MYHLIQPWEIKVFFWNTPYYILLWYRKALSDFWGYKRLFPPYQMVPGSFDFKISSILFSLFVCFLLVSFVPSNMLFLFISIGIR